MHRSKTHAQLRVLWQLLSRCVIVTSSRRGSADLYMAACPDHSAVCVDIQGCFICLGACPGPFRTDSCVSPDVALRREGSDHEDALMHELVAMLLLLNLGMGRVDRIQTYIFLRHGCYLPHCGGRKSRIQCACRLVFSLCMSLKPCYSCHSWSLLVSDAGY